eukprot:920135-Rhodomonas_salina.2
MARYDDLWNQLQVQCARVLRTRCALPGTNIGGALHQNWESEQESLLKLEASAFFASGADARCVAGAACSRSRSSPDSLATALGESPVCLSCLAMLSRWATCRRYLPMPSLCYLPMPRLRGARSVRY